MADINRIRMDIETLGTITDQCQEGITRLSYSPSYRKGIKYLKERMKQTGLIDIREDGIGTLYGTLPGSDPSAAVIMTGSHLDSVFCGGNFDGAGGIVCSLEAVRMIAESGSKLKSPVDVIVTCMEEGARFPGLAGSRFMAGIFGERELDSFADYDGIPLRQAIETYGLDGDISNVSLAGKKIKTFLELHIELSQFMENNNINIGVVENIFGGERIQVILHGKVSHPSTPFPNRQDTSLAACRMITELAQKVEGAYHNKAMIAIGRMNVYPNTANSVPSRTEFFIDVRSAYKDAIDEIRSSIHQKAEEMQQIFNVRAEIKSALYKEPVPTTVYMRDYIEESAKELGLTTAHMVSGAAHDAMVLAAICDVGLLFVPNRGGLIHCPQEWTDYENLAMGSDVMYRTLRKIDDRK